MTDWGKHTMRIVHFVLLATFFTSTALADGDLDKEQSFNIEAQALDTALLDFSDQANVQLMVAASAVEGRDTDGVEGNLTPRSALTVLLDDNDLVFTEVGNTVAVTASDEGGDSDQKNSIPPAPILMAQNVSQTPANTETSRRTDDDGTSIVTGKVTDARTGANLKGAKVTVEETGQWTSTNDLGEFRFVNVPTGVTTLTVSFLGYAGQSASIGVYGPAVSTRFALRGGSEIEEIVVFGQRSARAQALNQERTAPNVSTVISSDLIGNFPGTTISDALRRAPGVAFEQDFATGEGTNIIIRGLEPDLNKVTLNGVELPEGSGEGRSASLNNILADSIESITINKTLLPSHDSGGTGGFVEIETKSPLDRPRRYANFQIEGAQRDKSFSEEFFASGTIAGTFGANENFGVSLSAQYRELSNNTTTYNHGLNFGQYLPLEADGTTNIRSTRDIDPRRNFPFESGAENVYANSLQTVFSDTQTDNLAFTLSAEWRPVEHTSLNLDYQNSVSDRNAFTRNTSLSGISRYEELPIAALGGELRRALSWDGRTSISQSFSITPQLEDKTEVFSFRGDSVFDRWELSYNAGYARGQQTVDPANVRFRGSVSSLDPSFVLPEATDPIEERILSLFGARMGDGLQLPLLTQAGFDLLNDEANYFLSSAVDSDVRFGENRRWTGGGSARRNFDGEILKYIKVGMDHELSYFETRSSGEVNVVRGSADLASLGVAFSDERLAAIGVDQGFRVASEAAIVALFDSVFDLAATDDRLTASTIFTDPLLEKTSTEERETAAYIEAQFQLGDVDVIGGVRTSTVTVDAVNRSGPRFIDESGVRDRDFEENSARLVSQTDSYTDILPRILVNYRPKENLVFRGGYFLSVARPEIEQLSSSQSISLILLEQFGPNENQPRLRVSQGNPGLRPASTHNFDMSAEYYNDQIGVLKAGAFYKRIDNFLQLNSFEVLDGLDGVELPDDPRFQDLPDNILLELSMPVNADDPAEIWGFEAAVERQLTFLPGFWGGLGLFANYTYTDSSKTVPINWNAPVFDINGDFVTRENETVLFNGAPFDGQPAHSGTIAVTYNKYGFDASLAYSFQDDRLTAFQGNNLSLGSNSSDSLDLRLEYQRDHGPGNYRMFLEASDLLRGTEDIGNVTTRGVAATSGIYLGGRNLRIGIAATF